MVTFNTHAHVSHFLTVILRLDESKTWAVDNRWKSKWLKPMFSKTKQYHRKTGNTWKHYIVIIVYHKIVQATASLMYFCCGPLLKILDFTALQWISWQHRVFLCISQGCERSPPPLQSTFSDSSHTIPFKSFWKNLPSEFKHTVGLFYTWVGVQQ